MIDPDARGPAPTVEVLFQRLDTDLPIPAYAHAGDAGLDLYARTDVVLDGGSRSMVATGLAVALPVGYAGFVHPRSGLAARAGITIVNAPGTIDAGYRGEIAVVLLNTSGQAYSITRGDRIAQLVIQQVATADLIEVTQLPGSDRGAGGFGSTGVG